MNPSLPESTLNESERTWGAVTAIWRMFGAPSTVNSRRSESLSVSSTRLSPGLMKKTRAAVQLSSRLR